MKKENLVLKEDLINEVSQRNSIKKTEAKKWVESVLDTIKDLVHEGKEVQLISFAKFYETMTPKRDGWNPQTQKAMVFKPRKIVKIKPSPKF